VTDDTPRRSGDYVVHAGDVTRERDAVIEAWRGNLGTPARHAPKFDWFYLRCPYGEPSVKLLRHQPSSRWVGACAAGPRCMEWQGHKLRAGVLVDMAVDAQHRTLGPAMMLQADLVETAAGRFDLLYGFPNRKSLPVVKRLGYDVLGHIPRFSRVLRHARYLERHLPRWLARSAGWLVDILRDTWSAVRGPRGTRPSATWSERVDPRMDVLWRQSSHGDGPITVRDTTFLRWRFDQSPAAATRYLLLGDRPEGPLLAWFACQVEGDTLMVRDFWSVDAGEGVGRRWIGALIRRARRDGHAAIALEYAAPAQKLAHWLDAGFSERERRPIVGKWLQGVPAGMPDTIEWHLTAADEDE
jgi:GNAT superfamily N-acetyltransferase